MKESYNSFARINTYREVVERVGYLLDNRDSTQEAEDYLMGFVRHQCDVTRSVTQGVADKSKANALEEYQRVLDKCETALKHCATHHFIGESGDKRTKALAAIAKLKGKQG